MLRAQGPGLPVCLTVTHLDCLILARSGFNHSVSYRWAMCFGTAHLVEDLGEKARALDARDGGVRRLRLNARHTIRSCASILSGYCRGPR
jgi:nitroimidazol reductase NimA-like FMN-containing flavoprotein (pyridoxamine 5'-phosphate oxidase superfamily)